MGSRKLEDHNSFQIGEHNMDPATVLGIITTVCVLSILGLFGCCVFAGTKKTSNANDNIRMLGGVLAIIAVVCVAILIVNMKVPV